ncbi:MAG: hypothetical protein GY832_23800 [Chloroflexi bacterium]|nr:hypothetical protein [Chloroflexota bacterium]
MKDPTRMIVRHEGEEMVVIWYTEEGSDVANPRHEDGSPLNQSDLIILARALDAELADLVDGRGRGIYVSKANPSV